MSGGCGAATLSGMWLRKIMAAMLCGATLAGAARADTFTGADWSVHFNRPDQTTSVASIGSDEFVIRDALRVLSRRQRAAVVLRYYEDLPETEIAQIIGCRPGTVKSLLDRATKKLRKELQP